MSVATVTKKILQAALFYEFSLDRHVPADHLLRSIDRFVDLDGLRRELAAFYSTIGRPSIAPELMIRMLLVGYCFGIRSERRLCQEVHLNLAYRWFCRLDLTDAVPDHSTFSKNRHGRFRDCDLLRHVFVVTVHRCVEEGLIGDLSTRTFNDQLLGIAVPDRWGGSGADTVAYVAALDAIFEIYARLYEPVLAWVRARHPQDAVEIAHASKSPTRRLVWSTSATTLPDVVHSVVNMTTLRPALAYPVVTGLRFIPIPIGIAVVLVVFGFRNVRFAENRRLRAIYLGLGLLLLSMTATAGLITSGAHRIWQAGSPIRWTLLAGECFVLAVNIVLFVVGYRFFNAAEGKNYRQFLSWYGIGYLLIALTASIVNHCCPN